MWVQRVFLSTGATALSKKLTRAQISRYLTAVATF